MTKGDHTDPCPPPLAFSVSPSNLEQEGPASMAMSAPALFADRYELSSLLGAGAMATVYLARDRDLEDVVALKILKPEVASTKLALDLFKREVRLARKVTHVNVARVYDIGESRGARFMTMEYIDGPSLATLLERAGAIDISDATRIALAISAGLVASHAANVIHRDLKPENVLLGASGRVVITDFGVARAMQAAGSTLSQGRPIGTPAYMPPEQIAGAADPDGRIDVYALGVLLYEMLTGVLPFGGGSILKVTAAHVGSKPADPSALRRGVSSALASVVLKCIELERARRYATIAEVAAAISAASTGPAPKAPTILPNTAKSIAVLAFRHADTDEDALLADGLWNELIATLARTSGLRVRARSPLASLRNVEPKDLGKRLGVDVVVSGSVRRIGLGIRISVKVVAVADGFSLWSERFEGARSDLFPMIDSVATGVGRALSLTQTAPPRQAPSDERAVELYLRARRERSFELFEQALRLAPDHPTILSAYALVTARAWYYGEDGAENAAVRARWSAKRAVEIAPHLADARHAFALCLLHDGDAAQSVAELRKIVDSFDFSAAHETLGGILHEVGLAAAARRHLDKALAIEPTGVEAIQELARLEALEGNWTAVDERLAQLAAIERAGGSDDRAARALPARLAFWRRDTQRAAALLRGEGPAGPVPASILNALHGTLDPRRIRAAFEQAALADGSQRRKALLHQLSCEVACALDCTDWALDALHGAMASHLVDLTWLRRCPLLVQLRSDVLYEDCERVLAKRAGDVAAAYQR